MNKLALIFNDDLDLSKGKTAAHAAHAASRIDKRDHEACITLKTSKEDFNELLHNARDNDLETGTIRDAGRTEIGAGTQTVLYVYGLKSRVDSVTGDLSLL